LLVWILRPSQISAQAQSLENEPVLLALIVVLVRDAKAVTE